MTTSRAISVTTKIGVGASSNLAPAKIEAASGLPPA
jgi:hypothetical protein